MKNLSHSSSHL